MDNKNLQFDLIAQDYLKRELFFQWLRRFFFINNELENEFDSVYQNAFYVSFYELVTEGLKYCNETLTKLNETNSTRDIELFENIIEGLNEFKSIFSISELQFIEYKRHSASHIFQDHYEKRFSENGKLIDKRKGRNIDDVNTELNAELLEKDFDSGFYDYMFKKVNPLITKLHKRINN